MVVCGVWWCVIVELCGGCVLCDDVKCVVVWYLMVTYIIVVCGTIRIINILGGL